MFEVFGMFWAHTCTVVAFDSFYLGLRFLRTQAQSVCGKDVILFMVAELLAVREFRDTWQSFRKFFGFEFRGHRASAFCSAG